MVNFSILGKEYECPNQPSEITLHEFTNLVQCEKSAPAKLKFIWDAQSAEERDALLKTVTDVDYQKDFIPFFVNWLVVLTKIEKEIWYLCPAHVLENLYAHLHGSFEMPKSQTQVEQIEHDGRTWYLPESLMKNSSVGEYVAAANFQDMSQRNDGNSVFFLSKICAILLRETKDAPFVDANLNNDQLFKSMTMDKVWAVCFFLTKRVQHLDAIIQIYTAMGAEVEAI